MSKSGEQGWRAVGGRTEDRAVLYSHQGGKLAAGFPEVIEALAQLPVGTVVDGELRAFVGGRVGSGALAHRRGRWVTTRRPAGPTSPADPRACGGDLKQMVRDIEYSGRSPRVRGRRVGRLPGRER